MAFQFKKHYTLAEARALLPEVCQWLEELSDLRQQLAQLDKHVQSLTQEGRDAGGRGVNQWLRAFSGVQVILARFHSREIQIKDMDRWLIDFPSMRGTREVFLCWEKGEEDIAYWHELDAGYAGREPL